MHHTKTLLLAALLSVTASWAYPVDYWAKYTDPEGDIAHVYRQGPQVPRDKIPFLISGIKNWSEGKYKARKDTRNKLIEIMNVEPAANVREARVMLEEIARLVRQFMPRGGG